MSINKVHNKMYIYCEGAKTEPSYISSYISEFASDKAKVLSIEPTRKNTPIQLVEEAIKKKEKCFSGDEFWVVYDRESVSKYSKENHKIALDKAKANGINVVISNVCFEFWILLHFEETTKTFSSYENLMNSSNLKDYLKRVGIRKYDKGSDELYHKINKGVAYARQRAKSVNSSVSQVAAMGVEPYELNPYSNVYELLDAIDAF